MGTEATTRGECHVKTEVMVPPAKEPAELGEMPGTDPSLETSEGEWPCWHLRLTLLASRPVRQSISVV